MSNASPGPDGVPSPLDPPKANTSKRTKWIVLLILVGVCGSPTAIFYWAHQYYRIYQVTASSMEPTIRLGEHVWTDMHYFRRHTLTHGEVVLITRPQGIMIFKRVIALPGDTIEGRDDVIYLNGDMLPEPYIRHVGSAPDYAQNFGPMKIKADQYFVMGDNRDNSLDSRFPEFGFVPRAAIIGRPLYIVITDDKDRKWKRIE